MAASIEPLVTPMSAGRPGGAANPFRWSLIGDWLAKGSSGLLLLALTHWLAPQAMGVAMLAAAITLLGQTLADAGLSRALIQEASDSPQHYNSVFWINLGLAALLCAGVVLLTPWVATHFNAAEAIDAIRVQSFGIVLNAMSGVHLALLNKRLHFRQLARVRAISAVTPPLIALPLAMLGLGYWSLVWAALAGSAAQVLAAAHHVHWRPSPPIRFNGTEPLLRYGFWITLEVVLGWSLLWLDSLLVGMALGIGALGIYRTGTQIALLAFGLVLGPMLPVYFAKFSLLHARSDDLRNICIRANEGFWMAGIGLALLLWFGTPLGVGLTLPGEWEETARATQWIGISMCLGWSVAANTEALRAIGMVRYTSALIFVSIAIYGLSLGLTAHLGLEAAAQTRCLATLLLLPIHWYLGKRILGSPLREQLRPLALPLLYGLLALIAGSQILELAQEFTQSMQIAHLLSLLAAVSIYSLLIVRRGIAWLRLQPLARLPTNSQND